MNNEIKLLVKRLVDLQKGLLAADESTKTISKRLAAIGLTSTPELNRQYRQMLVSTTGIEEFLSGVILFDETVRQKTDSGISFPEYLQERGIIPGIKVDEGTEPFGQEKVTKGLEGLISRFAEYARMGLKFSKWRAPFRISDVSPSKELIDESTKRMAEFARLSQEAGFIPIVESEVLIEGTHTTTRCADVTTAVLKALFTQLDINKVELTTTLLKTNMVLPGKDSAISAEPLEVAEATLRVLKTSVPSTLAGIVFLSGGQSPQEATVNLNEINKRKGDAPWELSFSFARALQGEAIALWKGEEGNVVKAQAAFYRRANLVSLARQGKYSFEMENG